MAFRHGGLARLAQCGHCGQYVYGARVDGCDTAVEVAPIPDVATVAIAVQAGLALHKLSEAAGGAYRVSSALRPGEAVTSAVVAAHGCGAGRLKFLEDSADPHQARATHGRHKGGRPHGAALDEASAASEAAGAASRHHSERCTGYSIEFNGRTIWSCGHGK
jgi:hypothetical protein